MVFYGYVSRGKTKPSEQLFGLYAVYFFDNNSCLSILNNLLLLYKDLLDLGTKLLHSWIIIFYTI